MVNRAYLHYKLGMLGQEDNPKFLSHFDQNSSQTSKYDSSEHLFECANWLRLALSQNEDLKEAHFLLGHLYEEGFSVDQNTVLAFESYKKAANLGCVKSNTKVAHFYFSGIPVSSQDAEMVGGLF